MDGGLSYVLTARGNITLCPRFPLTPQLLPFPRATSRIAECIQRLTKCQSRLSFRLNLCNGTWLPLENVMDCPLHCLCERESARFFRRESRIVSREIRSHPELESA